MILFIGKFLLLGILISSLIKELIPGDWIIRTLGNKCSYSVVVAAALGIPLYACGGGAIPIVTILVNSGMSKGAALAFFLSGPATTLSTLTILALIWGKKMFILYITVALFGAIILGWVYNLL